MHTSSQNKNNKRSLESKSGTNQNESSQSNSSPPLKSHKTSSLSITKKVAAQAELKRTESLEEIIAGARKGLKPVPTPTMAKSIPNLGSSIKVNNIMGIIPLLDNTIDDNI